MTMCRGPALAALLLLAIALPSPALAQDDSDPHVEAEVGAFDDEGEEQGESLLDEARSGPQAQSSWFVESVSFEQIERTDAAISQLRRLVQQTPESSEARADLMFRLAELYYDRARFYEQRAFLRRDEAAALANENPARARAYHERANEDLRQSDQFADQAIQLYADIVRLYGNSYEAIDAVLYFLGANLSQLERADEAKEIFEALIQTFPQSEYLAPSLLALGEYYFAVGDMHRAFEFFDAVTAFPDASYYPYALYKKAWALYNLARDDEGYAAAVQVLFDVIDVTSDTEHGGRILLRRDALRDMALFYSEVYPADRAMAFFGEIAPDEAFDLVFRLARIYGERGAYEDSSRLYRELIQMNPNSFSIVDYQREIAHNTQSSGDNERYILEVRRLVEVYDIARSFDDATPGKIRQSANQIEYLLRHTATTFHREAQVTLNDTYYAYAYNLYEDYIEHFAEGSPHAYTMWFYYAELLYRNQDWGRAARAYDQVLALSTPNQDAFDDDAILGGCVAYTKIADLGAIEAVASGDAGTDEAELPDIPEPQPLPETFDRMRVSCDQYVARGVDAEQVATIDFALAYTLYEFGHLNEAIPRFAALATDLEGLDIGDEDILNRAQISAELLLDSLTLMRRFEDMPPWIERLRAGPLNRGEFGERLAFLSEQINFQVCREMQTEGRSRDAGYCFIEFAENHFESTLLDRALYNAGLAFENADELEFALDAYGYLIEFRPDSELVPETILELGRTYHRIAIYDEAASRYEQFASIRPDSEDAVNALINASLFRTGLGQWDQAQRVLQTFVQLDGRNEAVTDEAVAEANFQMALVQKERARAVDAISAMQRFEQSYGNLLPGRAIEAHLYIADLQEARGRPDLVQRSYLAAIDAYSALDDEAKATLEPAALDAAARAQFAQGEEVFHRFDEIALRGSEEQVQEALEEKMALGAEAQTAFQAVFDYRRPGWTIAAFTRIGQLYQTFYLQIIDAPIPPGLSALEEDVYRTQLEERAEEVKQIAIDLYINALEVAREFGWFSDYSSMAAVSLQELVPDFRAGSEDRIDPGYDSSTFYQAEFVFELGEDRRATIGGQTGADPTQEGR